ncbi:MAG: ABC transporter permease [Planctomycetes bacterium]|nr:ABC transporter permease [Planctomycetota bacterium]MCB9869017.1 ABC transporter permease [Planctomycetota bacterium]MCB9887977.1 ABC transporter permease [Planctomycetota bacterium]
MGLAIYSLWHREVLRFLLDRARVFSSLGQPVIFWLLFSGALGQSSFRPGQLGYGEYFFVGGLAMTLLFTAIFSTITVIEDRKEGFLQGVLVAPVPRLAIVLGKVLGSTTLALLNGLVFCALMPVAGVPWTPLGLLTVVGVMTILALALAGMGYSLAWLMDSSAGYHGIMMVLFMPMLLLSGAFFPAQGAHWVMRGLMTVNPLTYGVGALRHAIYGSNSPATADLPGMPACLLVSVGFAAAMLALGTLTTLRRTARDAN